MSARWRAAILAAAAKHDARAEEEFRADVAATLQSLAGESFRDGAALYGFLYQREKAQHGGRSLGLSAMQRLRHLVAALWPILDAAQRGVSLIESDTLSDNSTSHPTAVQELV
jgi:hypothetical protein